MIIQMTKDNIESAMSIGIQRVDAGLDFLDVSDMLKLAQASPDGMCGVTLNMHGCSDCGHGGSTEVADMAHSIISADMIFSINELQTLHDFEGSADLQFYTTQEMFREMLDNLENLPNPENLSDVSGAAWEFTLSIENGEVVLTP